MWGKVQKVRVLDLILRQQQTNDSLVASQARPSDWFLVLGREGSREIIDLRFQTSSVLSRVKLWLSGMLISSPPPPPPLCCEIYSLSSDFGHDVRAKHSVCHEPRRPSSQM